MQNKEMDKEVVKYTVSELNRLSRQTLESKFPLIWVEGEISNFSMPASGHWYFKMKDKTATISCAMFKNQNSRSSFKPQNGIKVFARCKITIYEVSGNYQLIIEQIESAGIGALQRKFEELKKQLFDEGIFDDKHKLPIPKYPKKIGIITSPTGAAIQDILSILKRRYPIASVLVYPSIVQGNTLDGTSAAKELTERIIFANKENNCDVLILARGGGSIEDLWAFNDETLTRSIHNSNIPIISAVGHEVDYTICDFVSDCRAPTPSAAAEIVSPDINSIIQRLNEKELQLNHLILGFLQACYQKIDNLFMRIRNPNDYLLHIQTQIEGLQNRIYKNITSKIKIDKETLTHIDKNLQRNHPSEYLCNLSDRLCLLEKKLNNEIIKLLITKQEKWENSLRLLEAVSPLNTIKRGYAIVLNKDKKIIKRTSDIKINDRIFTMLGDGGVFSNIEEIQINQKNNAK
ncbi:MAG: exodeoxyribonuclease VII large subunit [Cellvibrionales bacterium]|jgi:exodeoxyribonuclease VII large subunit|nr:exodeoxyribonuclease VII large subunit [Cellvibrionales bacterium]